MDLNYFCWCSLFLRFERNPDENLSLELFAFGLFALWQWMFEAKRGYLFGKMSNAVNKGIKSFYLVFLFFLVTKQDIQC